MCLNSVFIKNVSASEGVINFFVTYLAGVGRERRKISDETGRGQKNFCDSNENVPDPYPPPTSQNEKSSSSTTFIPQAWLLHNHVLPYLPLIFRHGRNELRIY